MNDGQNCGEHANCGRNQRLTFKKVSGNDGIINFKVKANIPGAYNFTYETTHQGRAVVNKRNHNFLTNEDLYPVNFEVYPRITSVTPNAGSLGGNTLVTIAGSGFLSDGLGGTVSVTVGDVECAVESMTETQILCRTPAGSEEPPSFMESRLALFTDTPGESSSEFHKMHWSLNEINNAQRCKEVCAADYSCVAFIFQDQDATWNGCWIIDYHGADADSEATFRSEKWHAWANAQSGYIPWANRAVETTCFTGRGETYEGTAATTNRGHACKTGTFCRNPNPAEQKIPYCQQERDDSWVACQVVGCGQEPPKYSGNRGIATALQKKWVPDGGDYGQVSPAHFHNEAKHWIHPAFYLSGGKDHFFYSQDRAADYYMLWTKNYFIAPFAGEFSFFGISDDRMQLYTDFDPASGEYQKDFALWGAIGVDNRQDRSNESGGRRRLLAKGEKVYMETLNSEWGGNDRAIVGVIYHGADESTGVWQNSRAKKHFTQDQYAFDIQRLWFDTDGREERVWITMNVDREALEAGEGIGAGETFDASEGVQFRIEQCGDNNQCFTTEDIDTRNWSGNQVEAEIRVSAGFYAFKIFLLQFTCFCIV